MIDRSFQRDPMTRSERLTYWISLLVILGLFGAEIAVNYEPRKLAAVFFLGSWLLLVAIHELGHALMAWMCGWGVRRIVVGFGRIVYECRIGETPFELRTFPIEGFVQPYMKDLRSPRLKDGLIYAAGPGIELVLAVMLWWVMGSETMFTLTDHLGILFLQSFAAAAVVGAVINLIPMSSKEGEAWIANDGMGILLAIRRKDEDYRERLEVDGPGSDSD